MDVLEGISKKALQFVLEGEEEAGEDKLSLNNAVWLIKLQVQFADSKAQYTTHLSKNNGNHLPLIDHKPG